jgi:hypothetical protein
VLQVYLQLIKQSKGLSPMAVRPNSSSSLVASGVHKALLGTKSSGLSASRVSQVYSQLIKQSKGLSPMAVRPISSSSLVA